MIGCADCKEPQALLVGSGPSLESLASRLALAEAKRRGIPVVAINRSVTFLRAHGIAWHWWAAIDGTTIARFGQQAPRVGLLTSRPTADRICRGVVEIPGPWQIDTGQSVGGPVVGPHVQYWEGLPAPPAWGKRGHDWTITGAIALCAEFGWRRLLVVGVDQAGRAHHDGSKVDRPEHRWADERREVAQICDYCGVTLFSLFPAPYDEYDAAPDNAGAEKRGAELYARVARPD